MHSPLARRNAAVLALAAALLAGCAGPAAIEAPEPAPAPTPVPRNVEPPKPTINLDGFPLPYRQGYADGCASATGGERKDSARFAGDGNYRTGWQDGRALCARK
ncbi:MAG TPA: hypothetical protein VN789_13490 [Casimicrobiaceae bacterium]|jgi:hypothetical protein|nr:hypothetical protein [Casimicrobiaceae bacterium]